MAGADSLSGIKEHDLAKLGPCRICGRPMLGHANPLTFYRLTIERLMFNPQAIQRRVGLQMMLGSGPLAQIMGPDEDLAKIWAGPDQCVIAEECADEIPHLLMLMQQIDEARNG